MWGLGFVRTHAGVSCILPPGGAIWVARWICLLVFFFVLWTETDCGLGGRRWRRRVFFSNLVRDSSERRDHDRVAGHVWGKGGDCCVVLFTNHTQRPICISNENAPPATSGLLWSSWLDRNWRWGNPCKNSQKKTYLNLNHLVTTG